MPSFKSDESFLEKIAIGAIGTKKVFADLIRMGHNPIELERGSMSYKIWKKIKIKRIRVPDILCVDCGIRIESRAKTKLEISMSHSESNPERGWDYGMKDEDYVALVNCKKAGENPIDWVASDLVQYISVEKLRKAVKNKKVIYQKPKGAQEGFESRIIWPTATASSNGEIINVDKKSIQFIRTSDKRKIRVSLKRNDKKLKPLVNKNEEIVENQILASVVNANNRFQSNTVNQIYYLESLKSITLSERYAAAKALSYFNLRKVQEALISKLKDKNEHIYVKLETAASLIRLGYLDAYDYLRQCLRDSYLQNVLETVIVIAEIKNEISGNILSEILIDKAINGEIRAGAAWGLGELGYKDALESLIISFSEVDESIKIEAARSLAKLTEKYSGEIVKELGTSEDNLKPGIAWALTKSEDLKLDQLITRLTNNENRKWIAYILGMQGEGRFINEIEELKVKDPEVYFAATVLWKILTSWIYNLKEY